MSQRQLADWARTQQSSVSEYESRRKSPTLNVVERLLDAADHDLVARPRVFFEYVDDPDVGGYLVPDRLWQVPIPECYSRVVVFYLRAITGYDVWDLAIPEERIEFYGLAVHHGMRRSCSMPSMGRCWSKRGRAWTSRRSSEPRGNH